MKTWLLLAALLTVGCNAMGERGPDLCVDPAFGDDAYEQIVDAVREWDTLAGLQMTVRRGDLDDPSCVPVMLKESLPGQMRGFTHSIGGGEAGSYIELTDNGIFERETMLHEIGHLLTGSSHSANPADIMFHNVPNSDQDGSRHLTEADLARLDR